MSLAMKVEYEYASGKMALELEKKEGYYSLSHFQFIGKPASIMTKLFGTVKYKSKLSGAELVKLKNTLLKRPHGKVEICKKMYVIRPEEKNSMLSLKFPDALETVPLPRDTSDELAGLIDAATRS